MHSFTGGNGRTSERDCGWSGDSRKSLTALKECRGGLKFRPADRYPAKTGTHEHMIQGATLPRIITVRKIRNEGDRDLSRYNVVSIGVVGRRDSGSVVQ
jgi:hypothetical protein